MAKMNREQEQTFDEYVDNTVHALRHAAELELKGEHDKAESYLSYALECELEALSMLEHFAG